MHWILPKVKNPLIYFPLLFVLASCGGGGGGGNVSSSEPPVPPIDPSLPAPSKISQARPTPGSVTHSSNTDGILTSDKIQVSSNEDGSYNVVKNNNNFGKVSEGTNNYLETSTSNLVSNLHKYPDGSYMLYGTWSERKANGSLSIDNLFVGDVGVFVDGTEYEGSISQLTGTATYEDNVKFTKYNTNSNYYRSLCGTSCEGFQLYQATTETEAKRVIDIHKRYNDGFAIGDTLEGNMILEADFGDNNSLGYIEGEISNFTDKQIVSYENIGSSNNPNYALTFDTVNLPGKLNLGRLSIGASHSGFFDGDLQGSINSRNYRGKWGGQFYSYDSNYDHPTNIAGTLAASSGDFNIIAPWFISNNEISASLLPIHFRPPQEDNPRIGLVPDPDSDVPTSAPAPTPGGEAVIAVPTPTPAPTPEPVPVTPPTTVPDPVLGIDSNTGHKRVLPPTFEELGNVTTIRPEPDYSLAGPPYVDPWYSSYKYENTVTDNYVGPPPIPTVPSGDGRRILAWPKPYSDLSYASVAGFNYLLPINEETIYILGQLINSSRYVPRPTSIYPDIMSGGRTLYSFYYPMYDYINNDFTGEVRVNYRSNDGLVGWYNIDGDKGEYTSYIDIKATYDYSKGQAPSIEVYGKAGGIPGRTGLPGGEPIIFNSKVDKVGEFSEIKRGDTFTFTEGIFSFDGNHTEYPKTIAGKIVSIWDGGVDSIRSVFVADKNNVERLP